MIYYLLYIIYYMLYVICYMLYVICYILQMYITDYKLHIVRFQIFLAPDLPSGFSSFKFGCITLFPGAIASSFRFCHAPLFKKLSPSVRARVRASILIYRRFVICDAHWGSRNENTRHKPIILFHEKSRFVPTNENSSYRPHIEALEMWGTRNVRHSKCATK
jgi:hypothetical protein